LIKNRLTQVVKSSGGKLSFRQLEEFFRKVITKVELYKLKFVH